MTSQYLGMDEYRLYFDTMSIVLSKTQIELIANYANENAFDTEVEEATEKLEDRIDELEEANSDLLFSYKRMYEQMEEILKEHEDWIT